MPPLVSIAVMVTFGLPRKLIVLYSLASLGGINVFGRYTDWGFDWNTAQRLCVLPDYRRDARSN